MSKPEITPIKDRVVYALVGQFILFIGLGALVCVASHSFQPINEENVFWNRGMYLQCAAVAVAFVAAKRKPITSGFSSVVAAWLFVAAWAVYIQFTTMNQEQTWQSYTALTPYCALFSLLGAMIAAKLIRSMEPNITMTAANTDPDLKASTKLFISKNKKQVYFLGCSPLLIPKAGYFGAIATQMPQEVEMEEFKSRSAAIIDDLFDYYRTSHVDDENTIDSAISEAHKKLIRSCIDLLLSDQGDEIWASKKDENLKLPKTLSSEELATKILEWA